MANVIADRLITPDHLLKPPSVSATPIQKFYAGQNVFITGVTGFLGKCLLEKLLFACPDIEKIYVLMREKRGKNEQSRLDELLNSSVFLRLKDNLPHYKKKIKVISGDCVLEQMGISATDKQELLNEVNIVFHSAATVRFDEPLNVALGINLKATHDMIELSKEMKALKVFIHLSTAYCHCYSLNLGEHFYETPMDPMKLLKFIETADSQVVDAIAPKLVGKWPNTYSFSKAMTEDYLRQNGTNLPLGIYRPSIVISSYQEPVPNWADNWYGVNGYVTACASGLLRVMKAKKTGEANLVPVDMCTNGLIACAWDVYERYRNLAQEAKARPSSRDIRIYNYVLAENPIKWGEFYDHASEGGMVAPPLRTLWYRFLLMTTNNYLHAFNKFFLHWIPAFFLDAMAVCTGQKPQIFSLYDRVHKMEAVTVYFTTREWNFSNHNTLKLIAKMTKEDRQLFECDVRNINWKKFLENYFLGIRRYLLKDADSTIPEARRKYAKLIWMHRILTLIVFILTLRGAIGTGRFLHNQFGKLNRLARQLRH